MKNITITRSSVCMADDTDEHILKLTIDETESLESLFHQLKSKKFLPKINGNNVVWVLCADEIELFVFITKTDTEIKVASINSIGEIIKDKKLKFRYYSSPTSRAEYIFKLMDGNKYYLWRDGWQSEYNLYNITPEQESEWLTQIQKD
jgi:hypothetical protein